MNLQYSAGQPKKHSPIFSHFWLLSLPLLTVTACGSPTRETANQTGSQSASPLTAEAAQTTLPVRISREFFQNLFKQKIEVSINGVLLSYSGEGQWKEQPTTLPAPDQTTGIVLADFRDFIGCASIKEAANLQLCFNVMPDVSSVGLNAKDTVLEVPPEIFPENCNGSARQMVFRTASQQDSKQYSVEFSSTDTSCDVHVTVVMRATE